MPLVADRHQFELFSECANSNRLRDPPTRQHRMGMSIESHIAAAVEKSLKELLPGIVDQICANQSKPKRTLSHKDVCQRVGVSRNGLHIIRRSQTGFPRPMRSIGNKLLWWEHEVDAWLERDPDSTPY